MSDSLTAEELSTLAERLDVQVAVVDNQAQRSFDGVDLGAVNGSLFRLRVTLTNRSLVVLPPAGWAVLIPSVRRLLGVVDPAWSLRHITGDQHVLEPIRFAGLRPGESCDVDLLGETVLIQVPEVLPRWCLRNGDTVRVLAATNCDAVERFVAPIDPSIAYLDDTDSTVIADAAWRYARNAQLPPVDPSPLIPTPLDMSLSGGTLDLSGGIRFDVDGGVSQAMVDFWTERRCVLGIPEGSVPVIVRTAIDVAGPESYRLRITTDSVTVEAHNPAGANWGIMSMFGLLPDPDLPPVLACAEIDDAPRFSYRSLMVDIARNMRSTTFLKALLDQMSAYKFNHLHLHLSDDEGWRLEIPGLPELVSVGARRGHGPVETEHLGAQLGSGLDGGRSGCGYLRREEYVDLLKYAAARSITVIPEINSPGHSRAAVMSMESRFERTGDSTYRLVDPDDTTGLLTVQNYDRHAIVNPAVPGTWNFLRHVIGQVAAMHVEAGTPLTAWHCGGDEVHNILLGPGFVGAVPGTDDHPWERSPAADHLGLSSRELANWFVREVAQVAAGCGVPRLHVWQDGVAGIADAREVALPVTVETWLTVDQGAAEMLSDLRGRGFDTVAATPEFTYFDAPYEAHPREQGATWATRSLDERTAFGFAPDNLSQVARWRTDRHGRGFETTTPAATGTNVGVQAHLWSEATRTDEQAWAMLFPRCLAIAERAWHQAAWERPAVAGERYTFGGIDKESTVAASAFARALGTRELSKLDRAAVPYRVPLPGVIVHDGALSANVALPGLKIECSLDEGVTWFDFEGLPGATGEVLVRVRAAASERRSAPERVSVPGAGIDATDAGARVKGR